MTNYEGPFHSEVFYSNDIMHRDIADIYASDLTERYYIFIPWKYVIKKYVRFAVVYLFISAFWFNLFIFALVPVGSISTYQFYIFAKKSESMNISSKKLLLSMGAIIAVEMSVCAYVRYTLFGILFV